jgi:hypothetical protein
MEGVGKEMCRNRVLLQKNISEKNGNLVSVLTSSTILSVSQNDFENASAV